MDKDNRICVECSIESNFLPLPTTRKVKKVCSQHVFNNFNYRQIILNKHLYIGVLYVWICYFDMAICIYLSMVHGNIYLLHETNIGLKIPYIN